ncbi:MAG TPA: hypothetical protein VF491_14235 [Vicinamibacterales bacterium]
MTSLKAVSRTQGNNRALKAGDVKLRNYALEFEEIPVLVEAFRRMVRGLEFDVCEMALTTYICARAHGTRMTAIPVFLVRAFHHGAILKRTGGPVQHPSDLAGKRVGVNRGYTVTTGVWARAVLQEEYGLDLSGITWVCSGDEHVAEFVAPSNVERLRAGTTLIDALRAGELDAVIGLDGGGDGVEPLIAQPMVAGLAALDSRGHYPINHLVVIKDDLLDRDPDLAADVFEAFAQSKRQYVDDLLGGRIAQPTDVDRLHLEVAHRIGDPLPYGIDSNRRTIENLVAHAVTQGILRAPVPVEELFAPATRALQG